MTLVSCHLAPCASDARASASLSGYCCIAMFSKLSVFSLFAWLVDTAGMLRENVPLVASPVLGASCVSRAETMPSTLCACCGIGPFTLSDMLSGALLASREALSSSSETMSRTICFKVSTARSLTKRGSSSCGLMASWACIEWSESARRDLTANIKTSCVGSWLWLAMNCPRRRCAKSISCSSMECLNPSLVSR